MKIWQQCGWVELQDLMSQLHGVDKLLTCKQATSPDQVWISPELVPLLCNLSLWDVFPDHKAVLAGINLPQARLSALQWRLPGHVPWDHVDMDQWNSSPDLGPLLHSNPTHVGRVGLNNVHEGRVPRPNQDSTMDFHQWSKAFEKQVSQCIPHAAGRVDRSFYGRGQLTKPVPRHLKAPIPKLHRPGEAAQASGFLNRELLPRTNSSVGFSLSAMLPNKSSRVEETYESRMALWHSILRAGQILAQLSGQAAKMQCGFMQGKEAADVWYLVGVCHELATHQSVPVHGIVADLVKACNTLPRRPVFFCLARLGVPTWFLSAWQTHLAQFERYFVAKHCTSPPLLSVTEFPEGCPLACAAMTAVDFFWHWAMSSSVPRVLPVSFVDNVELLCNSLPDLLASAAAQERFCSPWTRKLTSLVFMLGHLCQRAAKQTRVIP